jgi:hypothetical protein
LFSMFVSDIATKFFITCIVPVGKSNITLLLRDACLQ